MDDRTRVMGAPLPSVTVTLSTGQTFEHLFASDQLLVGRARECDLVLEDLGVSRQHARIFQTGEGDWKIEDLHSSNGVVMDGQKVRSSSLVNADEVVLGGARLVFFIPEPDVLQEERTEVQPGKAGKAKGALKAPRRSLSLSGNRRIVRIGLWALVVGVVFVVGILLLGRQELPISGEQVESSLSEAALKETPQHLPDSVFQDHGAPPAPVQGVAPDAALASRHAETAQVYFDAGRLPDAVNEWKRALMLDPGNAVYSIKLEHAMDQITSKAEEAYRRGVRNVQFLNYEEAIRDWNQVLHLIPDRSHPLHQNALRNMEQTRAQMQR